MYFVPARRPAFRPELRSVDRALENLFSNALSANARHTTAQSPRITQDETAVTLTVDVPGLSREQISIQIDGPVVRLENVADAPRALKLAYELAHDIDADASEAKLENGVLTLKLARKAVVPTARTLSIS